MGGVAFAGIAGTDHDFSGKGYGTDEICVFCHTPHSDGAADPLWNRAVNAGSDYTTYSSATIDMTIGNPTGVSLACLSCHDGTIAIDSYGGRSGSGGTLNGSENLGQDLSDEHPISVIYDPTADPAFVAKATVTNILPLYGASSDTVECGTCHDVHDKSQKDFLRISNAASALCLTCHVK